MRYTHETIMRLAKNESYSPDTRITDLIDMGLVELGLDLGIVSQIEDEIYTVKYSNNPEFVGQQFRLGDTYCWITLKLPSDDVLAIQHFSESAHLRHPAYQTLKLETYIGAPILHGDETYGTLNFTQAEPRPDAFSDAEKNYVQWLATAIGTVLTEKSSVKQQES